jgi:hypothetical protein
MQEDEEEKVAGKGHPNSASKKKSPKLYAFCAKSHAAQIKSPA